MKLLKLSMIFAVAAVSVCAQSARVKPSPTPTPNPNLRPSVIFIPSAQNIPARARTSPSPTPVPTQRTGDDPDVLKVESTLVPIPVSVIDQSGRSVRDLKLE